MLRRSVHTATGLHEAGVGACHTPTGSPPVSSAATMLIFATCSLNSCFGTPLALAAVTGWPVMQRAVTEIVHAYKEARTIVQVRQHRQSNMFIVLRTGRTVLPSD